MFSKSVRAALIALTALAVSISASQSLSVKVTGPDAVESVEHLKVVATITNTGDEALKVLNDPSGALNDIPTDTFVIANAQGAQPSFTGVQVKYVLETAATLGAYTILAPGQAVQVEHDLSQAYNFTTSGEASYDIHASNKFYLVNGDSTISTIEAKVEPYSAKISGKLAVAHSTLARRANFNGCSSSQQNLLLSAASAASKYAVDAFSYVRSHTSPTPRYTTWFGTYTSARHGIVQSGFSAISGNSFSSFNYDCTCTKPDTYAYVYPSQFGTVYLCGAFWNAPMTGTDSKGGTLVHEASHFTKNGGTQDYAYGQSNCQALARSDPDKAVHNADCYEYFAENNPPLA